ncbi:MAG: DUF3718 domain-containing protein [Gammaproteobacteria bacterium]|nr:DUF3718 domain-containing protein [Gammaproteobacteria bacterium]
MKLIASAVVIPVMLAVTFSGQVHSADIVQNICGYIDSDNKSRLRDQLKSNKLRLKKIYKGLSCNGDSLLRFAMNRDSQKVGVFMTKRLSAKILKTVEPDGKTVYQWAQDSGKAESLIGQAIKARAKL